MAFDACAGTDCCADVEIGFDDSYLDLPVVNNVADVPYARIRIRVN